MTWHIGNIAEAVEESKANDAIFVVYIDGQDEMSAKLRRFVDDSRVHDKLNTSNFVAIKIQGNSLDYAQFMSVYKVVPIPSIFFIGKSGTPLGVATGIAASPEELLAKIDRVLLLAGKKPLEVTFEAPSTSSCFIVENKSRTIAGADEESQQSARQDDQATEQLKTITERMLVQRLPHQIHRHAKALKQRYLSPPVIAYPTPTTTTFSPKADEPHQSLNQPTVVPNQERPIEEPTLVLTPRLQQEVKPANVSRNENSAAPPGVSFQPTTTPAVSFHPATTNTSNLMPNVIPLLPAISAVPQGPQGQGRSTTDSERREAERTLEENRLQRLAAEQRQARENESRFHREARDEHVKEQEIKTMQERLRRERQEEQDTRDRIRHQIAADRAELNRRVAVMTADMNSTTSAATTLCASSLSSIDETRLQIRLPGGIHRTKSFPAGELLSTVRIYVRQELLSVSNTYDFTLATSYPHREFQYEDELKTLYELNLVPNAVVLVLKKEHVNRVTRTGGSIMSMFATVLWALLTPAAKAFDYINNMGIQRFAQKLRNMLANIGWIRPLPQATAGGDVVLVPGDAASARRNMDMFVLRPMPTPGHQQTPPSPPPSAAAKTQNTEMPPSKENAAAAAQVQAKKEHTNQQPQQAQTPPIIKASS
ncbi:LOW QUALITY PROTEIN: UBX domain-containing protein 4-like [Drosophila tropicalis]|uniref:LOW QUALITY PROTEIN: UBX domain-containing protein 4-like n=1 Tax=Drosophila tropicalis TaxID=46794 RepID=UPI0035ABE6B9